MDLGSLELMRHYASMIRKLCDAERVTSQHRTLAAARIAGEVMHAGVFTVPVKSHAR